MTLPTSDQDNDRAFRIAEYLLERTESGAIEWSERPDRRDAWDADLPSGNVEVGTADNDGVSPYDLRIYSPAPDFALAATITSNMIHPKARIVGDLWRVVNRAASKVDETLDGLLRDLEGP